MIERIAISIALAASLWPQSTPIAPAGGARIQAIVTKTGLLSGKKHVLRWEKFAGRFSTSPAAVSLSVDAASVQVLDDWLGDAKKEDVRKETVGKKVLDTARHPSIQFDSTSVTGDTNGSFQITGNLTIRGIANPVTVTARKTADGYEGECRFPMSAFGIKPPRAALGAIGTADQIVLQFSLPGKM
jgi:polyisoprenoid-binding protein YceI